MSCPLVRDLAAEGIPVRLTCGVLGHSRQAYYAWAENPVSDRELQDAYLTNALIDAHGDDPEFGYRFWPMGSNRPVMSSASGGSGGWLAAEAVAGDRAQGPARGRQEPGPAVHDDHVQGDFTAQRPDRVWVTDITEHPTAEGKLSCCAIKDLFSSRIVGYAIDGRMTAHLAVTACARPSPAGDRRALSWFTPTEGRNFAREAFVPS